MKEGLDRYSLSIYDSLDLLHITKWIIPRIPLKFNKDLYRSGVCGPLQIIVCGDLGV